MATGSTLKVGRQLLDRSIMLILEPGVVCRMQLDAGGSNVVRCMQSILFSVQMQEWFRVLEGAADFPLAISVAEGRQYKRLDVASAARTQTCIIAYVSVRILV